jgi:hypothetical protein
VQGGHSIATPNAGFSPPFAPHQLASLDLTLSEALRSYTHITFVTLKPYHNSPDSFTDILRVLKDRQSLLRLNVNELCMDEHSAPVLANIDGLHQLGLSNPTRAILNLLPEWLNRLSKSLVALHLTVKFQALHQN